MQPLTAIERNSLKAGGVLAQRVQFARNIGNHRVDYFRLREAINRTARSYLQAKGMSAAKLNTLFPPMAPPPAWRGMPTTGSVKTFVLLIEFKDQLHTNTANSINDIMFGNPAAGSPYESMAAYYRRSSYNQLNISGTTFAWYKIDKNRADINTNDAGRDGLIKEAIQHFDNQGHDFSQYDNNGDGVIDYFLVFWTGPDTGWGTFWWGYQTSFSDSSFKVDGVKLGKYSWQWEGLDATVPIHETGHALGLPDLYDYDDSVGPDGGCGGGDMMDANRFDHNCFSKWMLDWLTPTVIGSGAKQNVSLDPCGTSQDCVVVWPFLNNGEIFSELFMVQNRQLVGNDAGLPGPGLLIWHIDASLNTAGDDFACDNSYTAHKYIRLMEADGQEDIEALLGFDAGDFYDPGGNFSPYTTPSSARYDNRCSFVQVSNILNAGAAVSADIANLDRAVNLLTPALNFSDVPEMETTARAIVFEVTTCQATSFQITAGPNILSGPGSFEALPSPGASLPGLGSPATREARLWIKYTGQHDGDIATGEVTVQCVETGEQWVVPISANTIARPTVACVLALDQSNSMNWASGLPDFPTRNDVLKFSAPMFVYVLQEHNGIGVIDFDHDAYSRMDVEEAGPISGIDPARNHANTAIFNHAPNPNGWTAIGDAVELAQNKLTAAAGYDHRAMIVFTDGNETAAKYISDVLPLINDRVFAIALGTGDKIQPAALNALTNGSGGYLLLTGDMNSDDYFLLSKYYLQILAGATNTNIVLDPEGMIKPGQKQIIPFDLNEADISLDAILLGDAGLPVVDLSLETPAGNLITPADAVPAMGIQYAVVQGLRFYRATLPVPVGSGAHSGRWKAVLNVNNAVYKRVLSDLEKKDHEAYSRVLAHGVRYSLSIHSYSGIRLQARVLQDSNEPGAIFTLRTVLTEYGIPVSGGRAQVRANFERPDGTCGILGLAEDEAGSGIYSAALPAPLSGVYRFRVLASGSTLRGRPFTREHLLTGTVWKGGDTPPPSSKDDPQVEKDRWCRLWSCVLSEMVIRPRFEAQLKKMGLDVEALRVCVKSWCERPVPPQGVVPGKEKPVISMKPSASRRAGGRRSSKTEQSK